MKIFNILHKIFLNKHKANYGNGTTFTCIAQDTGNGVPSADVVLYGLGLVIPLMNAELLKVCNVYVL